MEFFLSLQKDVLQGLHQYLAYSPLQKGYTKHPWDGWLVVTMKSLTAESSECQFNFIINNEKQIQQKLQSRFG